MDAMTKPPLWFWIVAILSLLWSIAGCFAYVTQVTMDAADLAKLPAEQREIWAMMPGWATAAYAIAVGLGLSGSVLLLLRRRFARSCFIASLVGVVVQFGWTFLATPILRTVGPAGSIPFPLFIFAVAAALVWFAGFAIRKGWLR